MSRDLLDEGALAASSVVANCAMNRERQLAGVNSYTRELGFNPLEWLRSRADSDSTGSPRVAWLDLCCGTGRALVQAAEQAHRDGIADRIRLSAKCRRSSAASKRLGSNSSSTLGRRSARPCSLPIAMVLLVEFRTPSMSAAVKPAG